MDAQELDLASIVASKTCGQSNIRWSANRRILHKMDFRLCTTHHFRLQVECKTNNCVIL
jgi:hypothetical protein